MQFLRLGAAGMRGEVGNGLTPSLAINYSSALGTFLDGGRIVIASDTRISSTMLKHAVISSLISCGCEVLDMGIAPAPLLHFAVPYLGADGGLLIGAGHHPAGWNALVPFSAQGAYLNSVQTQELLDIYHSGIFSRTKWNTGGSLKNAPSDLPDAYLGMLMSKIDTDLIAGQKFKVIADFCNGSGSSLAEKFASRLGIEMISINNRFSGNLPHDPEPRPRSGAQIQSVIKPLGADAGFVFNSDMSRASVVSDSGETLSEEYTFPLVADHVLARTETAKDVVTNWCTTRTLDDIVEKHGGTIHKTKVGQALIIDRMDELSAVMGGDGSGSVALGDFVRGFDSFMVVAMILESMAVNKCSSAELAEKLPRYHIVKKKLNCPSAHAYSLLRGLKNFYPEATMTEEDGFRFDWNEGWIHLRAAVTEPVIRMIAEFKTKAEAEDRSHHLRGILERLVVS